MDEYMLIQTRFWGVCNYYGVTTIYQYMTTIKEKQE